jgi:predicted nuclease with TOPRIM domain
MNSELADRNRKAIIQGLEEVNGRINDLTTQLGRINGLVSQLQHEIVQLKQEKMDDLVKKFGSGPTAN